MKALRPEELSRATRERIAVGMLLLLAGVGTLLYLTLGRALIEAIYADATPFTWLNERIQQSSGWPLNHYLRVADAWFVNVISLGLSICGALVFFRYYGRRLWRDDADSSSRGLPLSLLTAVLAYAWFNRFVQDDAFISFRYAANLANGHGLTWNPGEAPVEGYTNPLWTLLMALPIALGWDPVLPSQVLGVMAFGTSLVFTHALAREVLGTEREALLVSLLLGTNYTFSAYATGGLETSFQTALLTGAALLFWRLREAPADGQWTTWGGFSFLGAAAILTRPDSILLIGVLGCLLVGRIVKAPLSARQKGSAIAAMVLPAVCIGAVYGAWKWIYYGSLLPNTFVVKWMDSPPWTTGLYYIGWFLWSYGWLPFAIGLVVSFRSLRGTTRGLGGWLILVVIWLLYLVRIGGDFMEFRLLVPVLPILAILLVATISTAFSSSGGLALVVGLGAMAVYHRVVFQETPEGVESVRVLEAMITETRSDLTGKRLAELFGGDDSDVTLAIKAAGVVPYYSGLTTIDMLGLNDPWVARHGIVLPHEQPGHRVTAPIQYLLDRKVNLVASNLDRFPLRGNYAHYPLKKARFDVWDSEPIQLPATMRMLEIPLDHEMGVHLVYLYPHPRIDAVIAELGLRTFPIADQTLTDLEWEASAP